MSPKIRVLDDHTINKIAAGEVVEDPASVVKELVENALDARATDILVEIASGGRQLIRVSDNGCGMSRDDALLSIERHATSKIQKVEDIFAIDSMGFRGEAVPSIASVSKFTLLTSDRDHSQGEGTLLIVDGGRIHKCCSAARSQGTTIEVKSLFFNVPVRKKFQRSPTYDANEILKRMQLIALAHPAISFRLVHNQRTLFSAQATQGADETSRALEVLGQEYMVGTCPLSHSEGECKIRGFIGVPSFTRRNRTGQYIFVNNRPLQVPFVSFAVKDAYSTMIDSQRHPVFLLYFDLPGQWVDINVHPQKREARFRKEEAVRSALNQSIRAALSQAGSPQPEAFSDHSEERTKEKIAPASRPYSPPRSPPSSPTFSPSPSLRQSPSSPSFKFSYGSTSSKPLPPPSVREERPYTPSDPSPSLLSQEPTKKKARVLSLIPPYFLVEMEPGSIYYVDTKAARARISFERLKQKENCTSAAIQRLLSPSTLELNALESATLSAYLPEMRRLGFEIESFGKDSFIISGVPANTALQDVEFCIRELMEGLQESGEERLKEKQKEENLRTLARRAAAQSNKQLSLGQAQALIDELLNCDQMSYCPSGKPVMVALGAEEIAQQFKGKSE